MAFSLIDLSLYLVIMCKPIIQLDNVSKLYRTYQSPRHRMLDAIGFPLRKLSYDEFWAFRDLNLTIYPGERLGLIGRNGAGKSTLLKLIAGIIKPSSGTIKVAGKIQALMELGTGFHPELTGRKNVFSAFAYQGVVGKRANQLFEEVLEFSELEDFIDKPVKIYSSGMYARLAFAASTAIRPDILIIDEILGAGDAYFAGKSAKRMKDLTSEGTTVLFVSHDVAAVQMVCNRAIWIERGQIISDDNPIEVGKQYAASIRKQEELRLRAVNLKMSRGDAKTLLTDDEIEKPLIMRFVTASGEHPELPVRFYEVRLKHKEEVVHRLLVGGALDDDRTQQIHLLTAQSDTDWGLPKTDSNQRTYREFSDYKGRYQHAPLNLKIPVGLGELEEFSVDVCHAGNPAKEDVLCQVFNGKSYETIGSIARKTAGKSALTTQTFRLDALDAAVKLAPDATPKKDEAFTYGDKRASIEGVDFLDASGTSQRVFVFGEVLRVKIDWMAKEALEAMAFVVTFYGMDGRCVTQVISDFVSTTKHGYSGTTQARFEPLMVGAGEYIISVGIYDKKTEKNTIDEPLCVRTRQYRIKVIPPHDCQMERGLVVHPIAWQCESL
ncbi:MAG: ABC transporter ATP-binding protein [Legionellaceae bacterium]|nr:ABC transporter ATP-binding protein [Legionellaceae bacterium]